MPKKESAFEQIRKLDENLNVYGGAIPQSLTCCKCVIEWISKFLRHISASKLDQSLMATLGEFTRCATSRISRTLTALGEAEFTGLGIGITIDNLFFPLLKL